MRGGCHHVLGRASTDRSCARPAAGSATAAFRQARSPSTATTTQLETRAASTARYARSAASKTTTATWTALTRSLRARGPHTCAKQLANTDYCDRRRAGTLNDGYCAATCGVCVRARSLAAAATIAVAAAATKAVAAAAAIAVAAAAAIAVAADVIEIAAAITTALAAGGAELAHSQRGCSLRSKPRRVRSGQVQDCLWAAINDTECPVAVVMWSDTYSHYAPSWGCRCCTRHRWRPK